MEIKKIKIFISNLKKQNLANELLEKKLKTYLQVLILEKIFRNENFDFIFIGGTCLALCFDDDFLRLSEDLDFISRKNTSANELLVFLKKSLSVEELGFNFEIVERSKNSETQRIDIKFPDILEKLGFVNNLSDRRVLIVKVEYTLIRSIKKLTGSETLEIIIPAIINRNNRSIVIKRLKDEGLMASKMIACRDRKFEVGKTGVRIKGRDFYDLIWYMEHNIKPSIFILKIYDNPTTTKEIFSFLDKKILEITDNDLRVDIENLFINKEYVNFFIKDFQQKYQLLRQNYSIINTESSLIKDITKNIEGSNMIYAFIFCNYQGQNIKYFEIRVRLLKKEVERISSTLAHFKNKKETILRFMDINKYMSSNIEEIDKILISIIYDKINELIKTKGKDNILSNTVYYTDFLSIENLNTFFKEYSFKFLEPISGEVILIRSGLIDVKLPIKKKIYTLWVQFDTHMINIPTGVTFFNIQNDSKYYIRDIHLNGFNITFEDKNGFKKNNVQMIRWTINGD